MRFELLGLLGFFALGSILAAAYVGALEWNSRLYCRSNAKLAFGLHVVRLCGITALLASIMRAAGATALLATIVGFEAVRLVLVGAKSLRSGEIR